MSEHHAIGGHARAAKLSPERRAEIARKAAKERWLRKFEAKAERDWLHVASKGRKRR